MQDRNQCMLYMGVELLMHTCRYTAQMAYEGAATRAALASLSGYSCHTDGHHHVRAKDASARPTCC